jgi:UDP-N-acetylglucosamine--N-acetylmuramyl-(pentapeptide) pyrophosphoryl-undecaprenol N-acetylglucosamine transferase
MPPHTYIFAGGGTGGHIFPALAIAEELLARDPSARFHFLVSTRPLDATILKSQRLANSPPPFTPIDAHPFVRTPKGLYRFLTNWGQSLRQSRRAIRDARAHGPVVLVAMGGFVAAPAAQAARVERTPLALVNLDALPGLANRRIARRARLVITSAETPAHPTWTLVPPIVRPSLLTLPDRAACKARLGLDPATPVLLVTGGSQGASSINRLMIDLSQHHAEALRPWHILHQTGNRSERDADVEETLTRAGLRATVRPFVDDLGAWWGAADLAVSRSGAGNVGEAWATRTPAVFLPYPYHKDQHQRHNAAPLARARGAIIETDRIDPAANLAHAGAKIIALLNDASARDAMARAMQHVPPADGARRAAELLATLA